MVIMGSVRMRSFVTRNKDKAWPCGARELGRSCTEEVSWPRRNDLADGWKANRQVGRMPPIIQCRIKSRIVQF